MKKKIIVLAVAAAMVLSGCGSKGAETPSESQATAAVPSSSAAVQTTAEAASTAEDTTEAVSTEVSTAPASSAEAVQTTGDEKIMGSSVDSFNWKLFSSMAGDDNLFYSPYSIESALVLADAGAAGSTKEQMESVLGIDDLDVFLNGYKAFSSRKQADTAKLTTANSLWIDKDYLAEAGDINGTYKDKVSSYMGTKIHPAAFRSDLNSALSDITKWVKDSTGGLIPDYKAVADDSTVIDIINAVYFYGEWNNKFQSCDTTKLDFNGKTAKSNVDMMVKTGAYFRYYEGSGFRGLELPYSDEATVMDIFIPDSDSDMDAGTEWAALKDNEKADFIKALDEADPSMVTELTLPKFTMDITADGLKDKLEALGMKDAFTQDADFSGIAKSLYISDINHRAKIEVDEEGSRAAAVTEVPMALTAALNDEQKEIIFHCDHPFVFVIRNQEAGVTLFTGMVNDLK